MSRILHSEYRETTNKQRNTSNVQIYRKSKEPQYRMLSDLHLMNCVFMAKHFHF